MIVSSKNLCLLNCTFDHNRVSGSGYRSSVYVVDGHTEVRNCAYSRGPSSLEPIPVVWTDPAQTTIDYLASDLSFQADAYSVANYIRTEDLGFVNIETPDVALTDHRQKFRSILEDAGDPRTSRDFDLSIADIGWKKKYPVKSITEAIQGDQVQSGWYEITSTDPDTYEFPLGLMIQPDVVLRVTEDDCDVTLASNGDITIGQSDKPRVAFVGGVFVEEQLVAGSYFNVRGNSSTRSNTAVNGLLLNVAPRTAFSFSYLKNVTFVGSNDPVGENLQLANLGHGNLHFVDIRGTVRDFAFDQNGQNQFIFTPQEYNHVGVRSVAVVMGSKVKVVNCSFHENQDVTGTNYYPLWMLCGSNASVVDCEFDCSASYVGRPIAQINNGSARLRGNAFTGGNEYLLDLHCNATDMSDEACNSFSPNSSVADLDYLVYEFYGHTLMDCGCNGFANPTWDLTDNSFFQFGVS